MWLFINKQILSYLKSVFFKNIKQKNNYYSGHLYNVNKDTFYVDGMDLVMITKIDAPIINI